MTIIFTPKDLSKGVFVGGTSVVNAPNVEHNDLYLGLIDHPTLETADICIRNLKR